MAAVRGFWTAVLLVEGKRPDYCLVPSARERVMMQARS